MDLRQLEYFVRVAELGSFTRAAHAINVAQPALSRQVRLLEVELRQNLLLRNGRGATPTEAGQLLLEHGRGILHQVARAREEMGRVRNALAGRVAIGLPPSVAKMLTVPVTRLFRQHMPEASLSISEGLSAAMTESLLNGRLDIALLYNAVPSSGIELTHLLEEELFLVQRRVHPTRRPSRSGRGARAKATNSRPELDGVDTGASIALTQVATLPLVIPTRPNAIRMQVESELALLGLRPLVALEIDGIPAILDLVMDGAGSAILSRIAVSTSSHAETLLLRPISRPKLRSRLFIAVSAHRPATLTQITTMELLRAEALSRLREK